MYQQIDVNHRLYGIFCIYIRDLHKGGFSILFCLVSKYSQFQKSIYLQ